MSISCHMMFIIVKDAILLIYQKIIAVIIVIYHIVMIVQEKNIYHKCDECERKWCHFDGRDADYRCPKIGIRRSSCQECGL